MNKKVQKGLVAAVAATMGASVVAPVVQAATQTLAQQYEAAYKAYEKAAASKDQKDLTAARGLLEDLYKTVKGTKEEYLATTLSSILDPVQQEKFEFIINVAEKTAVEAIEQKNINEAKYNFVNLSDSWKVAFNAYSSALDVKQTEFAGYVLGLVEDATTVEELEAAKVKFADLMTMEYADDYKAACKTTIEAKIAEVEAVVSVVKVDSVNVVGAKKFEVKFNKAVDTTKAAITVKKGTVSTNVEKITFSEDKKSAVIETTTKLSKGDYTVTVAGLNETALVTTVTAVDEKVGKINITSPTAPVVSGSEDTAVVRYEILNQYDEVVTKTYESAITWTISTGKPVTTGVNGKITITNAGTVDFIPGAKVYVTGVHAASGTVVNGEVSIGLEAKVDQVTFKGLYNVDEDDFDASFEDNQFQLLFEAKDQYGNKVDLTSFSDLVFTSTNPLFATVGTAATDVVIDGVTYEAINIVKGANSTLGGDATIQVISKLTGKQASYKFSSEALASVKTFSISAPDKIVALGEKVEIPFTAVDQYGNAVTKYSNLDGKVDFSEGLAFEQQNDGTAKLYYTAPTSLAGVTDTTDAPVYLTSLISNGGSFSSLMVSVKNTAAPTTIIGLDAAKVTTIAKGNKATIKAQDLIIQDQYGRTMSDTKVNAWLDKSGTAINVLSSDTAIVSPNVQLTASGTGVELSGVAKGSATVTFTLAKVDTGVAGTDDVNLIKNSAKTIAFNVVEQSAYASYEVADLGTMYNDGLAGTATAEKYNKTVKVYGVKADGTKVLLPKGDYTVSTNGELLVTDNVISDVATGGYDAATDLKDADKNYDDATVNVIVQVMDGSGSTVSVLEKELIVSNRTPKVQTIAVDEDVVTDGKASIKSAIITNGDLNAAIDTTELRDQYGVVITETPVITITNLSKVTDSALAVKQNGTIYTNITAAAMGDKFTATYKYEGGVKVSVDYTVGLDTSAAADRDALTVTYDGVSGTLNLPTAATHASTITWAEKTDASSVSTLDVATSIATITRSAADDIDDTVTFTATVVNGTTTVTKDFTITVKEDKAPTLSLTSTSATAPVITASEKLYYKDADGKLVALAGGTLDATAANALFVKTGTVTINSAVINATNNTWTFDVSGAVVGDKITYNDEQLFDANGKSLAGNTVTATFNGTVWELTVTTI